MSTICKALDLSFMKQSLFTVISVIYEIINYMIIRASGPEQKQKSRCGNKQCLRCVKNVIIGRNVLVRVL